MKNLAVVISAVLVLTATSGYAGNGDLIVKGGLGVGLGVGTPLGALHIGSPGPQSWSASNAGTNLIVQGYGRHPSIGIFDINNANPWAIANASGDLYFLTMPTLGDVSTAPITRIIVPGTTSTVNMGIGIYPAPDYALHINGSVAATGTKNFDIADPRYKDESKRLVHAAIEGPEAAVFYRGEVKLQNGGATVTLPDYFEALTRKENRTVQLTPKFENSTEPLCPVAASDVTDGAFVIRALAANPAACSHKVYWEVKGERGDIGKLKPEQFREPEGVKLKMGK